MRRSLDSRSILGRTRDRKEVETNLELLVVFVVRVVEGDDFGFESEALLRMRRISNRNTEKRESKAHVNDVNLALSFPASDSAFDSPAAMSPSEALTSLIVEDVVSLDLDRYGS
jgi:hypothetical protein